MNVNTPALLALVVGVGVGAYFWMRYKRFIIYLARALRFATDQRYTMQHYNVLDSPTFYETSRYNYNLLPYDQHAQAIYISKAHVTRSIKDEYAAISKLMLVRFTKIAALPFIVSVFFSQGITFMCGMLITLCIAASIRVFATEQRGVWSHEQTGILLRHAYADAGYIYNPHAAQAQTPYAPAKQTAHNPVHAQPTTYQFTPIQEPRTAQKQSFYKRFLHASWEEIWWLNDLAFSVLISILYWFTNAKTIGDYLLGTIQIVLCLQLFFVVTWAVVKIAKKLLAAHPEDSLFSTN